MPDNSTKIIILGVSYLMIFSVCMGYFIQESGQSAPGFRSFPYCPIQDPRCHTLTNSTDFKGMNTSIPVDLVVEGYIGNWDIDSNGLTSSGDGDNWVFLAPAYDAVNSTYYQNITISNPDNLEFDIVIGYAWAPIPLIYNPDVTRLRVASGYASLVQSGGVFALPWETVLDIVNYPDLNELGTYTILTWYGTTSSGLPPGGWTSASDPYHYYVAAQVVEAGITLRGEETVARSIQYAGGVHVIGKNLTIEKSYTQQSHYMAEGTEDWAAMFRAVLAVIFWQVPSSVMPFELVFIFIVVPEMGIALAIVSRLYPL